MLVYGCLLSVLLACLGPYFGPENSRLGWRLALGAHKPGTICQHSSNMSPYSLNERCSQPKPGPLRETSTVTIQITIITIAVRPISWGHVGARWGHVGPMSSPIGRSFRPPLGATERNWSVLQKMPFRLGESVISGRPSWPRVGATLGYVRAMLGSCGAYTGRTKLSDEMKASQSLPSSILTSERLEAGDFPDLFLVA